MPLIEIQSLCAAYDTRTVLHDVNLTVDAGDYLGITGPNGGGKTTLLKCILGLLKPTAGSIVRTSLRTPGTQPVVGYLPQYSRIDLRFPISVGEVILSGLACRKPLVSRFTDTDREKARRVLTRMGLEGLERRPIGALSGGQLQRTLLGRAIIADPEVLVLDEPDTYIDQQFASRLYPLLAELNRSCAILLVSHNLPTLVRETRRVAYVDETLCWM